MSRLRAFHLLKNEYPSFQLYIIPQSERQRSLDIIEISIRPPSAPAISLKHQDIVLCGVAV